ncbi:hypothetical protein D7316_04646 [Gordonia insulae]|uniref:Uncharacterized protein n=1 Tax=Gordonia insulae TaxID=2420509 RepID=A0A3G8JT05_9ACTN|nr:hypothetical protein D7316_04646 [Gordonia insulae]
MIVGATQATQPASAHAAPTGQLAEVGKVTATYTKNTGAVASVKVGKFVLDQATGAVELVDEAGDVAAQFVPKVVVDGVVEPLQAVITNGGKTLSLVSTSAIRVGANIAAFTATQAGNAAQRCVAAGLMPALTATLIGAITAGVGGFFAGGFGAIPAAVGGAVLTGFSGFGAACLTAAAKGVVEDTLNGDLPKQIVEIPFG